MTDRYGYQQRPMPRGGQRTSGVTMPAHTLPRAVSAAQKHTPILPEDRALMELEIELPEEAVLPAEACFYDGQDLADFTVDGDLLIEEWAEDTEAGGCGTIMSEFITPDTEGVWDPQGIRGLGAVALECPRYVEGIFRELDGSTGFTLGFVVETTALTGRDATLLHAIGADSSDIEMMKVQFVQGAGTRHKVVVRGRRIQSVAVDVAESGEFLRGGFHTVVLSWNFATTTLMVMVDGSVAINDSAFSTAGAFTHPFDPEFMFMAMGVEYDLTDAYAPINCLDGAIGEIRLWGTALDTAQARLAHAEMLARWPALGAEVTFEESGAYTYAVINRSTTFVIPITTTVDMLVVGAGAGGEANRAGSGGAGGAVTIETGLSATFGDSFVVTIGRGGQGEIADAGDTHNAEDGGDTEVDFDGDTYTATGGSVGSAGSDASYDDPGDPGTGDIQAGGGGHSAGGNGSDGVASAGVGTGGAGAAGLALTDWPASRSGGGGGGAASRETLVAGTLTAGAGGSGGGGAGGTAVFGTPGAGHGTDGSGYGGGGGGAARDGEADPIRGGRGANGIVVLRWLTP